ncbi:hypothetical protein GCM10028864_22450 [Microlunatus parietis]
MMPSEPASANPCNAAFRVWDELMLIAGYAKAFCFAFCSISAYTSGDAMGIGHHFLAVRVLTAAVCQSRPGGL